MAIFVIFFFFFFPLIESYALCRQLMGRAADERTGRMDGWSSAYGESMLLARWLVTRYYCWCCCCFCCTYPDRQSAVCQIPDVDMCQANRGSEFSKRKWDISNGRKLCICLMAIYMNLIHVPMHSFILLLLVVPLLLLFPYAIFFLSLYFYVVHSFVQFFGASTYSVNG